MRPALSLTLAAGALLAMACQSGLDAKTELPPLDEPYFRCKAEPVLLKSCAQLRCHGDPERYFRLYARNRDRFQGGVEDQNAKLSDAERTLNYDAARAFVDLSSPDESLLLTKPLDVFAGGAYHGGATVFGQGDVYLAKTERDYVTLAAWVHRAVEPDAGCCDPGDDLCGF